MTSPRIKRVSSSFSPPVELRLSGAQPIYLQISDWYRTAIASGLLRPGQRVPSTRAFADELKISRISVLSAYEQLTSEGYFETFVGAGTYVARSIPDEALRPATATGRKPKQCDSDRDTFASVSRYAPSQNALAWTWLKNLGAFRVGLPAVDQFPHAIWSKIVNRHVRRPPREMMIYGDPMGYMPFREAIAEYLSTSRAVRCDASHILVTTGSQAALPLCANVLLDAKQSIWMEEPGYFGAHEVLIAAGVRIIPVPVGQGGLDVAKGMHLGRGARAAFITPSHQFPLGMIMSAARRMQLLNWAAQNHAWIIEDDYDSEFRFEGRPLASLQGLDVNNRVIYVGTLSKSMFPALRLGYMVIPKALASAFYSARVTFRGQPPALYQAVMTDFIREGHFARHIRRMRMLYARRQQALLDAIHAHLRNKFEIIGAAAGLQLAGFLPPGTDDVEVSNKAARMGISVMPLSPYYLSPSTKSGLVLGYGCVNEEEIRDGVRKLESCI
jgi:GntR family transcriptional regulator/MocR family aminotransferase